MIAWNFPLESRIPTWFPVFAGGAQAVAISILIADTDRNSFVHPLKKKSFPTPMSRNENFAIGTRYYSELTKQNSQITHQTMYESTRFHAKQSVPFRTHPKRVPNKHGCQELYEMSFLAMKSSPCSEMLTAFASSCDQRSSSIPFNVESNHLFGHISYESMKSVTHPPNNLPNLVSAFILIDALLLKIQNSAELQTVMFTLP